MQCDDEEEFRGFLFSILYIIYRLCREASRKGENTIDIG